MPGLDGRMSVCGPNDTRRRTHEGNVHASDVSNVRWSLRAPRLAAVVRQMDNKCDALTQPPVACAPNAYGEAALKRIILARPTRLTVTTYSVARRVGLTSTPIVAPLPFLRSIRPSATVELPLEVANVTT